MARSLRWGTYGALLALLLLACAPTPQATPAPATLAPTATPPQIEGELRIICTVADDWCMGMTQAFEAQTGIRTSFIRLSSGEALEQLRSDQGNPSYDIWHGGPADGYVAAKEEGLLQPYESPSRARIPDFLKDPDQYWTGAYVGALGFCNNLSRLEALGVAPPQSWEELLDPRLEGQLAMAHPATSGTAYTALWTLVTLNEGDRDRAFAYFSQLYDNGLQFTRAGIAPAQMAARGEIAVGITFSHDCARSSLEAAPGQRLMVSYPAEGTGYEVGGLGIIEGTPHLHAARSYVDWALSKGAQELPATLHWYQLPTNPEAAIPEQAASDVKLIDYDFGAAGHARRELAERFSTTVAPAPPP